MSLTSTLIARKTPGPDQLRCVPTTDERSCIESAVGQPVPFECRFIVPLLTTLSPNVMTLLLSARIFPFGPTVVGPLVAVGVVRFAPGPRYKIPLTTSSLLLSCSNRLLATVTRPNGLLIVQRPAGFGPPVFVNVCCRVPLKIRLKLLLPPVSPIVTFPRASIIAIPSLPCVHVRSPFIRKRSFGFPSPPTFPTTFTIILLKSTVEATLFWMKNVISLPMTKTVPLSWLKVAAATFLKDPPNCPPSVIEPVGALNV